MGAQARRGDRSDARIDRTRRSADLIPIAARGSRRLLHVCDVPAPLQRRTRVVWRRRGAHYGTRVRRRSGGVACQARMPGSFSPDPWCRQAGGTTIGGLFAARARIDAAEVALIEGARRLTFAAAERAREPPRPCAGGRGRPPGRSGRHARPQLRRLGRAGAGRGQARRDRRGAELAPRPARAGALHPPRRAPRHAGGRGLCRDAGRPGRGAAAHDHARRRLRGPPGARRRERAAGRRRARGRPRDPLHQRHDRPAQGRGGQPPRVHRPRAGVHDRARPRAGRGVRRLAAVLPHGLDRSCAGQPVARQPGDRGRRLRRARRWSTSSRASASAGCRWCPA